MPGEESALPSDLKLASRVFRIAAIYGVVVLAPLYLAPVPDPWRLTHFGFIGVALVFQGVFWVIASDPQRFMPLMPLCIWEKLCFGIPALAFFARGQADAVSAAFGAIDLFLGALFFLAWRRMRAAT